MANRIAQEIHSGTRPPGSKLPSLAAQQTEGLSQTTTLRAYQELINQGLAVAVQGSGTYVADPLPAMTPETPLDALTRRVEALEAWRREMEPK